MSAEAQTHGQRKYPTGAFPLNRSQDLDPLMDRIGDACLVLLGEASHGTHEYYTWRTRLSKRLIEEKGFSFIAVEADWPDCYQLNQFIKDDPGSKASSAQVLRNFVRWPTWMWANWEISALTDWLRGYNDGLSPEKKWDFTGWTYTVCGIRWSACWTTSKRKIPMPLVWLKRLFSVSNLTVKKVSGTPRLLR